jgi:7,8-dihydropterin-6-yl-methyl-4-(beta-D-ribofuranosyl)aminobenzene 5'-phosphate synthase
MKLIYIILITIIILSLSACSPITEMLVETAAPITSLPSGTYTPLVTSVALLPITEQGDITEATQTPMPATDIPEDVMVSPQPDTQVITITIVYDNYLVDERLRSDWGFSALIQYGDHTLLFDTGGNGLILLQNMRILGIDLLQIDGVVLSHAHDDHTGGLMSLLNTGVKPTVYLLSSFPASFKRQTEQYTQVNEVLPGQIFTDGVWTTGDVGGSIPEQSLVIQTVQGLVIITGCAHPGIVNILEHVHDMNSAPLYLVLGGFHLGGKSEAEINAIVQEFRRMEVVHAAPCHCSGDLAIEKFATEYGSDYVKVGVGSILRFETIPED